MTAGTVTLLPSPLRPVGVASVQGTLALDLTPRQDPPDVSPQAASPAGDVVDIGRSGEGSRVTVPAVIANRPWTRRGGPTAGPA